MGLNKSEKINYLSIVNGKIAKLCTAETPDAQEYVNKDNNKKYYLFYDSLDGFLESISFKNPPEQHPEYSSNWILRVKDGNETYQLQINFSSGYATGFFCQLPNINPELPVVLAPSVRKSVWEGKEREQRNIFVKQNSEALKWAYTKNDPGKLPAIEVVKTKNGKVFYDDEDRNNFFKKLAQIYNEQRQAVKKDEPEPEAEPATVETENNEPEDDLPF